MIVVDASIIVDIALGWRTESLRERLSRSTELHVPVTIEAEVLHALRRHWLAKALPPETAEAALAILAGNALTRHPVQPLAERMWSLRENITAYDAGYVALAESLDVPLVTRDYRLSRSSGHSARIEYID